MCHFALYEGENSDLTEGGNIFVVWYSYFVWSFSLEIEFICDIVHVGTARVV